MDLEKMPQPLKEEPTIDYTAIPEPRSHTAMLVLAFILGVCGLYLMLPGSLSGAEASPSPIQTSAAP